MSKMENFYGPSKNNKVITNAVIDNTEIFLKWKFCFLELLAILYSEGFTTLSKFTYKIANL